MKNFKIYRTKFIVLAITILFFGANSMAQDNSKAIYGTPDHPSDQEIVNKHNILKEKGYLLEGRKLVDSLEIVNNSCSEYGRVAVRIYVNKEGIVTKTLAPVRWSTTSDSCLVDLAKNKVKSMVFSPKDNQTELQTGTVLVSFKQKSE